MVTRGNQHTRPTRSPQGSEGPIPEANKIWASTPYDLGGKNLTAYGSATGGDVAGEVGFPTTGGGNAEGEAGYPGDEHVPVRAGHGVGAVCRFCTAASSAVPGARADPGGHPEGA